MGNKLGRQYTLRVQTGSVADGIDNVLAIELPITLEFDISRNFLGGGANTATFRVYNLSRNHRNSLRFDQDNYGVYQSVQLFAGYGTNLYEIFKGNLRRGSSIREGVNYITTLECLDGGFAYNNGFFSDVFPKNTSDATKFETIIKQSMPNVSVGAIGNFPATNSTPAPYSEPSTSLLRRLSDKKFFVDNEKAHVLNTNEYIDGPILKITPQTGLLQTPQLEESILHIDILFEPRLTIGSLINLQSTKDSKFNRTWRVNSIKHRGIVSPAVSGEAVTSISINYGSEVYLPVRSKT